MNASDINRITFDEVCKHHNPDGSPKEGVEHIYIGYPVPHKITIPGAEEIIGYFSGEENMWAHCIYYKRKVIK